MIFYFLFKEDYIANRPSGWKAKNLLSFYYLPNTNQFIVVNSCQVTPFPAAHQAYGVWRVGACRCPSESGGSQTCCLPTVSFTAWHLWGLGSKVLSLRCPSNQLGMAPTSCHCQISVGFVRPSSRYDRETLQISLYVVTTGYRNCISSIRRSQKYSERLAGYSECRSQAKIKYHLVNLECFLIGNTLY